MASSFYGSIRLKRVSIFKSSVILFEVLLNHESNSLKIFLDDSVRVRFQRKGIESATS